MTQENRSVEPEESKTEECVENGYSTWITASFVIAIVLYSIWRQLGNPDIFLGVYRGEFSSHLLLAFSFASLGGAIMLLYLRNKKLLK